MKGRGAEAHLICRRTASITVMRGEIEDERLWPLPADLDRPDGLLSSRGGAVLLLLLLWQWRRRHIRGDDSGRRGLRLDNQLGGRFGLGLEVEAGHPQTPTTTASWDWIGRGGGSGCSEGGLFTRFLGTLEIEEVTSRVD